MAGRMAGQTTSTEGKASDQGQRSPLARTIPVSLSKRSAFW